MIQNSTTALRFKPMAPINQRQTIERTDDGDTLETSRPLESLSATDRPILLNEPDGMVKPPSPGPGKEPPTVVFAVSIIVLTIFALYCLSHFSTNLHQH